MSQAVRVGPVRRRLVGRVEGELARALEDCRARGVTTRVDEERAQVGVALLRTLDRALEREQLGSGAIHGLFQALLRGLAEDAAREPASRKRFRERFGVDAPGFLAIAPGKNCNLRCAGCYAASGPRLEERMGFALLDRVVGEAEALWGDRFFVLTGGEPFLYRDQGRGILDLAGAHPASYFLVYTNGTLITPAVADRIASLGNLTVALSVEGLEESTDRRRGAGVFQRVVAAMGHLRQVGVAFGLSVTPTAENYRELLSGRFLDFVRDQGALYVWVFQYMPVGRAPSLDRKHDYRFQTEPRGHEQASPWRAGGLVAGPRGATAGLRPGTERSSRRRSASS